ncbi:NAD(P)H-hydrate dehydratase [Rickettsiales bacterium]|nr:NAD(P)H-hydrate dehydratase [Rickettsiales bacterium]
MSSDNILTIKQIIQSENDFFKKNPKKNIMDIAGLKIWKSIKKLIKNKKTLFVTGYGNNGIDGKRVYELAKKNKCNVKLLDLRKNNFTTDNHIFDRLLDQNEIIVDAIFGIGLNKDVNGENKKIIQKINLIKKYVISIDIPSGIYADSGDIKKIAIKAKLTLAMGFLKPGHLLLPGKKFCGEVRVIDLGLDPLKRSPKIRLIDEKIVKNNLPTTSIDTHKYLKGNVLVFGGKIPGASRLTALAARKVGAGLSTIHLPKKYLKYYPYVEPGTIMNFDKNINFLKFSTIVIGPGLGLKFKKKKILNSLNNKIPVIIDADALSIFKSNPGNLFAELIKKNNSVLTPHHGEFKRIFKFKKSDKINLTIKAAKLSSSIVVYKGNDTVIACPNGNVWISNNAKKSLATAGTGDILCGLIAGISAQKADLEIATVIAVWIHGKLSHNSNNVIAEDFINEIPHVIETINNN